MSATLFGLPTTVFWIDVCASWLFVAGLIQISRTVAREQGVDKIAPFGLVFFAMAMGVFGSEHFTATASVASLIPRWIPAHAFWVYLVGLEFVGAALLIAVGVGARLAAALVGATLLLFVFVLDVPAVVRNPGNRFSWALALRQLAFSGGAFAFALSPGIPRRQPSCTPPMAAPAALPRFFVGVPSVFYGVQHLLHPAYVPGVPLQKLTPEWIQGRIMLSYFVGAVLILAGVCLLLNKKTRTAATWLGLTILLTIVWVYVPMLFAAPKDVVALNFFFDTLLFCGAILLLANATSKEAGRPSTGATGAKPRGLTVAFVVFGVFLGAGAHARATQSDKDRYQAMAPVEQYLMPDEQAEIALARSAAPASISNDASVMVLGRKGYTTAVKGTNGFLCIVERSWGASTDDPDFWNPRVRSPICFNPPAAKTVVPLFLMKTQLVLASKSTAAIVRAIASDLDRKELPPLDPAAMCYMMSKQQYLNDKDKSAGPHLMFFVSGDTTKSWGGNLPGSPVIAANDPEERMTIFILPVGKWSDGTRVGAQ
jgi:uncharacterized membrane protein YphA (DoxX/SURF4 family)